MTEGGWLNLATFWPSLAVLIAMLRSARVADLKDQIELLKTQHESCEEQVRRLRFEIDYLLESEERRSGRRPPTWPEKKPEVHP